MVLLMVVALLNLLLHCVGRNDLDLCQILSIFVHQIAALHQILAALLCDNGDLLVVGGVGAVLCVNAFVVVEQR